MEWGQVVNDQRGFARWITSKDKRDTLTFIGTGLGAVALGLWTVFVYFHKEPVTPPASSTASKGPSVTIEATYFVCVSDIRAGCSKETTTFLPCGSNISEWAKKECGAYDLTDPQIWPNGGHCAAQSAQIKCTANK
jgi:hypothetical protein